MKKLIYILTLISTISCSHKEEQNTNKNADSIINETKVLAKNIVEEKAKNISPERIKLIEEFTKKIRQFTELNGYSLDTDKETFFIEGDFYGDKIEDIALLLKDKAKVRLCIINYGEKNTVEFIGDLFAKKPLNPADYSWAGVLKKINAGEVLFSNYDEDFRGLEDVPENEKVILDYDAILVHNAESCGGGFIFWKNGKFNWLQQE